MVQINRKTRRKLMELVIMILRQRGKPISTNELAQTLGRSWAFTNRLLNAMKTEGIVKRFNYGIGKYWALR